MKQSQLNANPEAGFLDEQLAQLLLRLCHTAGVELDSQQQATLSQLARHTSLTTRQGIVAAPLPADLDLASLPDDLPVLGKPGDYKPLIMEQGHVWLNRYWQYEQRLADNIRARLHRLALHPTQAASLEQSLQTWFTHPDTALQAHAVAQAAQHPFLIISGGPGTGKTTTVTRLLCLLIEQMNIAPGRIRLAAPTGKAAMRLQEAIQQAKRKLDLSAELAADIPEQGSTLHRLLGYIPGRTSFVHNRHNPLPADVVIVDEASMIDIALMTQLFEAVPTQARLILLGDKDQLASVETGSIFRDLCADTQASVHPLDTHTVVLKKSWRFAQDSGIGQLAQAVLTQQTDAIRQLLQQPPPDLIWQPQARLDAQHLQSLWRDYLQSVRHWSAQQATDADLQALFAAFNHFRILTPMRQGPLGTETINQSLNRLLAPALGHYRPAQWFAGRPIMVTENDYRQRLFNGDIGLTLPDHTGQLKVWFVDTQHGGFRALSPVRLPRHETTWAMTIHKSQGSEFDKVLMLLPEQADARILVRELIYTGITRARKQLIIMGKENVLLAAMRRSLPDTSRIRARLRQSTQTQS